MSPWSVDGSAALHEDAIFWLASLLLIASVVDLWPKGVMAVRTWGKAFWGGVGLLMATFLVFEAVWVPWAPWAMNHHGLEAWLRHGLPDHLAPLEHGVANRWVWWSLSAAMPGPIQPDLDSLIVSLVTLLLFAGWVRRVTGQDRVALLAVAWWLAQPTVVRLAPSASSYVLVQLGLVVGVAGLTEIAAS